VVSSAEGTSGSTVGRHSGTSVGGARGPFAATVGTPFYRLHKSAELAVLVLTLLSHGCPTQAIVAAFGLDERTVARWLLEAGRHGQRVHEHLVEQGQVDLQHVQADELWVKQVGGKVWMALALAVPTRLWLGGVISHQRDLPLITRLVQRVRACAVTPSILVCVDGLVSYVTAFWKVFRQPIRTGRRGRPRLVLPDGFQFAQVVKHAAKRHVVGVTRRVLHGTLAGIEAVLTATATGTVINTAYIERLNATFRAHLAPLTRRGRAIAHTEATLTAGMWLVGTAYNFCWPHDSLRLLAAPGAPRKWHDRTPAMAAGLADHCWTLDELLRLQIPLPRWVPPKRRGRPPKHQPLESAA
jgi:transposase-like protein